MTDWDKEAKRLLPCIHGDGEFYMCNACIAAALAAAEARGLGTDKTKLMGWLYGARSACDMLHSELAQLRAERDAAVQRLKIAKAELAVDEVESHFRQLEAERDAAVVQGLERANIILRYCLGRTNELDAKAFACVSDAKDAIQAEIDKRKGK